MTREEFLENEKKKREKSGKDESTTTKEARDEARRINFLVNQELYRNPVDAYDSYTAGYSDAYSLGEKLANERNDILKTSDENQLTNYYRAYLDGANRAVDNNDMVGYWTNQIMLDRISQKLGKATPTNFAKDIGSEFSQGVTGALTDIGSAAGYVGTSLTDQLDGEVLYNVAKSTNGNLQTTLDNYGWGKDNYERLQRLKDENPDDKYINMLYDTVTKQGYTGDKKTIETLARYINEKNNKKRYDNWLSENGIADFNTMRENQKIKEVSRGYSGLSQFALDAAGVIGNMAPSIATGMAAGEIASGLQAANSVAQGVQQGTALAGMGASAFGGATTSAINRGADWSSAGEYGTLMAGIEVGTELIGGESVNALLFGKPLAKTALSPAVSKLIEKGTSDATRFMIAAVTDIGSEAMEEMISAALEPFLNYIYLDEETSAKQYLDGILEGALGSIIPTLILGGLGKVETIQAVNKTQEELLSKIESYRGLGTELFPEEKLNEMAETVKLWSNRAKAGISEHYDEIKNETTNYNDVMGQMYLDLDIRPILSQDIAEYAMSLDIADPQEREQAIIDYAKERGINNEELRRMFPNYEEMFPHTTQQYRNYLGAFSNLAQSQGQVANQVNQGQSLGTIMGAFNSTQNGQPAITSIRPTADFSGNEYDWLKQFVQEENNNGITRLTLDKNLPDIQNDAIYGTYDESNAPSSKELDNSPVALDIDEIRNVDDAPIGPGYYVYPNVASALKDIENNFGSLEQFEFNSGGFYEILSLDGKGKYTLNISFDNPDNPLQEWLPPRAKSTQDVQQPQQPKPENKPEVETPKEPQKEPKAKPETNKPANKPKNETKKPAAKEPSVRYAELVKKYGGGTPSTQYGIGFIAVKENAEKGQNFEQAIKKFWFSNSEVGPDFGDRNSTTQEELNRQPVVLTRRLSVIIGDTLIFKNIDDAKKYMKAAKISLKSTNTSSRGDYSLQSVSGLGAYYAKPVGGKLVWYSIYDGGKVGEQTILDEDMFGDSISILNKKPKVPGHNPEIVGKKFKTLSELANILQATIYPFSEFNRYVLAKGDEIVGLETQTSNEPGRTMNWNSRQEFLKYLTHKAEVLGADRIITTHNHPDKSTPSPDDKGSVESFRRWFDSSAWNPKNITYEGEIVIGLDDHSFIYPDGKIEKHFQYDGGKKFTDEYFKKDRIWNTAYNSLYDWYEVSKKLPTQKGYSKLIFTDFDGMARLIVNVKNEFLSETTKDIVLNYLHDIAIEYGAWTYRTITDNKKVFDAVQDLRTSRAALVKDYDSTNYNSAEIDYYYPYKKKVGLGHGITQRKAVAYYLTPESEMVDDEQYLGRDLKTKETKKEPRRRLAKKGAEEFASKVIEQYNQPSAEAEDMMDIIPTDIELMNGADDLEQQIREIESGKKERELNRARNGIHDMRRYINKINFARTGLLKGPASRTAFGIWKGKTHWLRVTQRSNISTWFHEWGHEINASGLDMKALEKAMAKTPAIREELNKLCEERYDNRYDKKPEKKLGEGFAEAIRRYILNPERFADNFTNVATMFVNEAENNKNFAEMLAHMKVLSEMVKDYINDTGSGRVMSNIDMHGRGEEPVYVENTLQRFLTRITEDIFNDMVYLTKLDRAKAKGLRVKYSDLLSSEKIEDTLRLKGNAQRILTQLGRGMYDDYGNKITTGLSEIMEDFLPTKEEAKAMGKTLNEAINSRVEDLVKYGVALRELSLLQNRDLMMGTRLEDLKSTVEEYKKDAKLNQAIKQINENSQALIKLSVEKGLISAETGKQILRDNLMYFPLNRVMEDRLSTALGNSRDGSTGKTYYQVKGSGLQISNPLISLMNNWGRVMYQIEHNDMLKTLVDFSKDVDTIGDWIDIGVAPNMEHRGQVSMEVFKSAFEKELGDTAKHLKINIPVSKVIENMNFDEVYNLFIPSKGDASQRMLTYIDKGVRKTIQFANNDLGNGLYRMLTNMDIQKNSKLLNLINAINMPLKVGATAWNVEFALSNMQSDALQRFLYSNGTAFYIPLITSMYNVAKYMNGRYSGSLPWDTKTAGELYEKFLRSGASQEGTFRGEQLWLRDHVKDVFGYAEDVLFGKEKIKTFDDFKRKFDIKKANIAEKLNYVSEISEQATRFAEFSMVYNQMKAKGFSETVAVREAGMKARQVTQDFTVQGRLMREINKIVPFASATVGGLYRFGQEARNHPVRLTGRLAVLAGLAMFLEGLMDGEDREYYEEINKKKRFDNFFIPNPDDPQHPFIIKKPQGPARYLLNFAQLMTNVSLGRIKEEDVTKEFYDWLAMSVDDQMPVSKATDVLPPVFQAIIENNMNKDFYYGTPIVSKDLEKLDPRHQYDEYTSEVAKAIGNAFNWSPAKVDNIIKTWTAGFGKQILDAIDVAVRGPQDNEAPDKDQSELLGLSKFYGNAFRSSESINQVYDRLEYLETEEAEDRITEAETREYSRLQEAKSALSQINKQLNATRENAKLNSAEKAEKMDRLREERIDTARYYLGKTLLNNSNLSKIEKIAYYPANDTYSYTNKNDKKKYEVTFDEKLKDQYATKFQKKYEEELEKLRNTAAYKQSTEQEKLELEKKTKTSARTETTNEMKEIAYKQQYKN